MISPVADSVRLALPAEAAAIAALQRRAWAERLPATLDGLADELDLEAMTVTWHAAILRPPEARYRVLVAVDDGGVRGFATTTPSSDPDADRGADGVVDEFAIDPTARRRGHGGRLVNACVDTLRADGFARAQWWVDSTDDVLRRFLLAAGWAPDGAHRELGLDDTDDVRLKQIRLHSDIGPVDSAGG
ncbi:MAG: GNAT family N-acetyltransferase [Propionibacteriaceae bacterium]